MSKFQKKTHREREALIELGRQYTIWTDVEQLRQAKDEMGWPDWYYLPMGCWHAIASQHEASPISISKLTSKLSALGAWRMTQGIYRFDPALYPALIETPISGDIPIDVLYQLPEWCIYIETPGLKLENVDMYGAWCHLEYDYNTKRHELRFLVDTDADLYPITLHLTKSSLDYSSEETLNKSEKQAKAASLGFLFSKGGREPLKEMLPSLLSLVLYIYAVSKNLHGAALKIFLPIHSPKRPKKVGSYFLLTGH